MECSIQNNPVILPQLPIFHIEQVGPEKRESEVKLIPPSSGITAKPQTVASVKIQPDDYIAFQLSFIPEIRAAFVRCDQSVYYVTVLVDGRDLVLNRRIFERERSVIHYYREYRFDFNILPLSGQNLSEMKLSRGKRVL